MKENTQKAFHIQVAEKAAKELAEHFDTVQILVSVEHEDPSLLVTYRTGRGSILARVRQAGEWVEFQNEFLRHEAARKADANDGENIDYDERDQEAGNE